MNMLSSIHWSYNIDYVNNSGIRCLPMLRIQPAGQCSPEDKHPGGKAGCLRSDQLLPACYSSSW